jgi:alkyl hydroperoxide reductase subunit AhpF
LSENNIDIFQAAYFILQHLVGFHFWRELQQRHVFNDARKARSVIIATGAKWRNMNVPGEDQYRTKGVTYCPHCDGPLFDIFQAAYFILQHLVGFHFWRELQQRHVFNDARQIDQYRTKGVTYCPHCDGPLFKGKRVAVIGGGNSGGLTAVANHFGGLGVENNIDIFQAAYFILQHLVGFALRA